MKWLSLVEHYTHPTAPVELRQAVAIGLGNLWKILLQVMKSTKMQTLGAPRACMTLPTITY